ncbi:MAG: preprotein translocase subunit SecG [Clostridia bacterium]|nr:preprotein translocase subunit SecG [Clostridia bacterium]
MDLVLGIILLVAAVFLIVAVLMQSGKSHNLSGSIAGGAETFFGKTKGKTIDKLLSKVTTVVAILFTVLVVVVYVLQPNTAEEDHTGHDHEEITQTENADDHEDHDHADDTAAE